MNSDDPQGAQRFTDKELRDVEREMSSFERATLRWAKVAVGMSFVAAIFISLQWCEMRRSAGDTHTLAQAAKRQAEKLGDMSKAADKIKLAARNMAAQEKEIANSTRKSLAESAAQNQKVVAAELGNSRLDQRAWVVLKGVAGKPTLNKPLTLRVYFTNTGRTPARDVRVSCAVSAGTGEMPPTLEGRPYGNPNFLAPNALIFSSLRDSAKVSQSALDALSKGAVTLFVYGSALYDDVFGRTHWLTFCEFLTPDASSWDPCKRYNDTGNGDKPPS